LADNTDSRMSGWMFRWWVPLLIVGLIWFVAPALITTENAIVYIGDCFDQECALQGDLSRNLFTRDYELTQADGSVVMFSPEAVNMMSWTVPAD